MKKNDKKKKKYNVWLDDDNYRPSRDGPIDTEIAHLSQSQEMMEDRPPPLMILPKRDSPSFFLGLPSGPGRDNYVGIPQGTEENIMVVGGNGSGKSAGVAKPTLRTWRGAICATDIKGELSKFYEDLYQEGLVTRPYIVFDPTQADGPSFDPFGWLLRDSEDNLLSNINEIVTAIIPALPNDKELFWTETEQGILSAALLHYFKLGLSFSETVCAILSSTISELCAELVQSQDIFMQIILGDIGSSKPETRACFDRGLRNKLMLFATDRYISHIPADRIEQWSGAINLMYTQLIRHLERRPDMHAPEGQHNIQTLLLMDEFARFGKLEMITDAMATLRSKNVNICLMIQSVAQLDKIYGEDDRKIIFDNCKFQAILRANDADTQKYLCELIGTRLTIQRGVSEQEDEDGDTIGYSRQFSEIRDWTVQPHELATLNDVLLLTPYGFCRAEKFRLYDERMKSMLFDTPDVICVEGTSVAVSEDTDLQSLLYVVSRPAGVIPNTSKKNKGARIMPIEERVANAQKKVQDAERRRRSEQRNAQEAQRKKDWRRNCVIGALVTKYFPSVLGYEPGTNAENQPQLESIEAFLYVLSADYDLVKELQDRAAQLMLDAPDGEWRPPK